MKIRLIKSIIFCFICLNFSCHNLTDGSNGGKDESLVVDLMKNQNRFYLEQLNKVEKKYTMHFPEVLDTNNIMVTGTPTDKPNQFILEVINRFYKKGLGSEYFNSCIAKYSADDPCVLTFDKFDSFRKYPSSKFNACLINKYPIPDFRRSDFRDLSNASKLSSDFNIYILEAKPSKVITDSLVNNNELLLEKWKNGFSRGVAISEEKMIIIYWTIVW